MPAPAHPTQRRVLSRLMRAPTLGFNELWAKEGESNAFAYHLEKMEHAGLISKSADGKYALTRAGRELSAHVEGSTGSPSKFPTLAVLMVVRDGENFLCHRRDKEPFFGYWSLPSGKVRFGENLDECARRELEEETGLVATEWRVKGIEQVKTFESGELAFHHHLIVMEATGIEGKLRDTGQHEWFTHQQLAQQKTFPGNWCMEDILPSERFVLIEGEREIRDGRFVSATLKRKTVL